MSTPEQPNRQMLLLRALTMLLGVILIALPTSQVVDLVGLALILVAVIVMLSSLGWIFTRRG